MALDQQYTSISTTVLSILKCRMKQRWNKVRNWHNYCTYGCKDISSPPTHYPRSIPSSHHIGSLRGHLGFSLDLWLLEETHPSSTRIQILNRKVDSRTLERQTNRKMEIKKRYEERPRRPPAPSFTPPSACRWNDRNKEEMNRGQRRKNERTGVGFYKTNPHPVCDWHLVTVTSSSRLCHTRQTHRWISPGIGLWHSVIFASCHLSSAFHITFHTKTRTKRLPSSRAVCGHLIKWLWNASIQTLC